LLKFNLNLKRKKNLISSLSIFLAIVLAPELIIAQVNTTSHQFNLYTSGSVQNYGNTGGAGTITLGPFTTTQANISTTASSNFLFNKDIRVSTGALGSSSGNVSLKTGATTRMTILSSNGNVGIGTTSPSQKLHIVGNALISQGNRLDFGDIYDQSKAYLSFDAQNTPYYFSDVNYRGHLHFNRKSKTNPDIWYTEGTTMSLQDDGTITMGVWLNYSNTTYDTQGHRLAVNGKILCEGVKVIANVPDADYVFQDGYYLRPLSEVEAFVKEHKHLPGAPSAAEFAECGYNVGDMDNKLLEKVEELTLYMIQMKAELDALKKENEELRRDNR
jgi:hypothetical protein